NIPYINSFPTRRSSDLWQTETGPTVHIKNTDGIEFKADTKVANVGSRSIEYNEWISQLLEAHGKEELKELVNKELVQQAAEEKEDRKSTRLNSSHVSIS